MVPFLMAGYMSVQYAESGQAVTELVLMQDHVAEGRFPDWPAGTAVDGLVPCRKYSRWWQGQVDGYDTYFPADILDNGRLACAYNPTELSLPAGSRVTLLAVFGGWAWCVHGERRGWLPLDKLQSSSFPELI